MSLLHLLIAISAVGAVAFFLAGWLAKPRGASEPALANEVRQRREAEEARALAQAAYDEARAQLDVLRTTLKETAAELIARSTRGSGPRGPQRGGAPTRQCARGCPAPDQRSQDPERPIASRRDLQSTSVRARPEDGRDLGATARRTTS